MPIPQTDQSLALSRMTAKKRICQVLCQWIVEGALEPGERLNDAEIAQYFSVSRTPVREAFQMLEEQGFLNVIPSRGTFVSMINRDDLERIYDLMGDLQGLALDYCGELTKENLRQLEQLNERLLLCAKTGDVLSTIQADHDFHRYLNELSGNSYLIAFFEQLELQARRSEIRFFKEKIRFFDSYYGHQRILAALRDGNKESAKQELKKNWNIALCCAPEE